MSLVFDPLCVYTVRKDGLYRRVSIKFPSIGRTKQSFKDQCDINKIVAKAHSSGLISHLNSQKAIYGDFSNLGDYRDSLDRVQRAETLFMSLPSAVRSRFGNDPAQLLGFLKSPDNRKEAIELGLIDKPVDDGELPLRRKDLKEGIEKLGDVVKPKKVSDKGSE